MTQGLISLIAFISIAFSHYSTIISPVGGNSVVEQKQEIVLASQTLDLTKRYNNDFVNNVFEDNILLALHYLKGETIERETNSEKIRQAFKASFILKPGEVFAFHQNVLPEFKDKAVKTIGNKFIAVEGYRSSGFIVGDGVCHLASLMNWVASEAGLEVVAKVRHNFAPVPGVEKKYGTSIRYSKKGHNSQNQNLYIKNNFDFPVEFKFEVKEGKVKLEIASS